MAVTGDDLARLEGGPDVLGDLLVRRSLADLGAHLLEPSEDLLVGEAVRVSPVSLDIKVLLTRGGDRRDR